MVASPQASDRIDERLQQQAKRLEALLGKLVKPPTEPGLTDIELSHREIHLLMALDERGEMSMTDLAGFLNAPLSTVTRMVDRLSCRAMVERSRSTQDRRQVVVRPSAKARALGETFHRHRLDISRRMLEPLSLGEREILLELMAKMAHSLPTDLP